MTRILITGGAGFIGSHLADSLVEDGHAVTALDLLHPQAHGPARSAPGYVHPAVRLVRGDVRDAELVHALLDDADVVVHLAAYTGVGQSMYQVTDYLDVNVMGTATLLEALSAHRDHIRKLIVASSRAVYGEGAYRCSQCGPVSPAPRSVAQMRRGEWQVRCPACSRPVTPLPTPEDQPANPGSIYAVGKLAQEQACLAMGRAYGVPVTALRYFNVYGPRQSLRNPYTGVITAFITRLMNGRPPQVYEDGQASRDFVHVSDVVRATRLAIDSDAVAGQRFNVGTGEPLNLLEIAQELSRAFDGPEPIVTGRFRVGDIRHCHADVTLSRRVLGYTPRVDFTTGIRDLAARLAGQHWDDRSAIAEQVLRAHGLSAQARP
jgi:dTDP-L-rhamnose 4-epimerase